MKFYCWEISTGTKKPHTEFPSTHWTRMDCQCSEFLLRGYSSVSASLQPFWNDGFTVARELTTGQEKVKKRRTVANIKLQRPFYSQAVSGIPSVSLSLSRPWMSKLLHGPQVASGIIGAAEPVRGTRTEPPDSPPPACRGTPKWGREEGHESYRTLATPLCSQKI